MSRSAHCCVAICAVAIGLDGASRALGQAFAEVGTIASSEEGSEGINSYRLEELIDLVMPANAQRLMVFTQCYAGNMAGVFSTKGNTSVITATDRDKKAGYGGYDKATADNLKPEVGRTAKTVHDAGVTNKLAEETPKTYGGVAPQNFSLAPVVDNAQSPIRSRHILIYAGKPDGNDTTTDVTLRDKVKQNFKDEPKTQVISVGGKGGGGWDQPGTYRGLINALKAIRDAVKASPDPSKEQFIMYVGDHGGKSLIQTIGALPVPGNSTTVAMADGFDSSNGFTSSAITSDANAKPGFTFLVDYTQNGLTPVPGDTAQPIFHPGDWQLEVGPHGFTPGTGTLLTDFTSQMVDLSLIDGADLIGDQPGEGEQIFFPMDKYAFGSFFDMSYDMRFTNMTGQSYTLTEWGESSGPLAKLVPEPGTLVLAGVASTLLLARRRRRLHP